MAPGDAGRRGPGDAELRAARRGRVFDAMAAAGLDVLVLGRRDSVAYATGARSLWTAGTRPFGAACVLVGAGRSTYLLSTWDAGVPPEVPFEHLYGITWNPARMAASLSAIPGLPDARRIGVDALTPGFERAARRLAPGADLVPVDDLLRAMRAIKLPAEIELIRAAVAVAAAAVEAAAAVLASGASAAQARAAAIRFLAAEGVTVPSSEPMVRVVDPDHGLVHIDIGVLVDGYEGGLGRTVPVLTGSTAGPDAPTNVGWAGGATGGSPDAGPDAPVDPRLAQVATAQQRLLEACRPGATGRQLRQAAATAAATTPTTGCTWWMVRGCGMGFEPPVTTERLGHGAVIEEGMVLSVEIEVDGVRRRDLALVGRHATEVF